MHQIFKQVLCLLGVKASAKPRLGADRARWQEWAFHPAPALEPLLRRLGALALAVWTGLRPDRAPNGSETCLL